MKTIIVDLETINLINYDDFEKVYLVVYARDNIEELLNRYKKDFKVTLLLPSLNFDKAYIFINKYIANFVENNFILLSLFKLSKENLFNIGMIMVALNKKELGDYQLFTKFNDFLIDLKIIEKNKLYIQNKTKYGIKILYLKQFLLLFGLNLKVIFMLFKSFLYKNKKVNKLFMDYSSARILGEFPLEKNDLLIDLNSCGKSINYSAFKYFFKEQKQLISMSLKYKILHQNIAKQSYHLLKILSLVSYYKPNILLSVLDASVIADIYYRVLKNYNIKFGCYSHGFNYDFRTEYIYIPFDFYFVWSKAHLNQIKKGNYIINKNCKFYITGSPFYKNIDFTLLKQKNEKVKYDILVIGEYYYNNYSVQPFNSSATLKLAKVLSKYKNTYRICIRPRSKDEYYNDMYSVLGDSVIYSFPSNENTATTSILDDIQSSSLIVSMISGGIHDALLSHKPVLQANFLGIKEPKEFDINNTVYYADTPLKLEMTIDKFFDNKLNELDYNKSNEYYFHNGKFDIEKIEKIINDNI